MKFLFLLLLTTPLSMASSLDNLSCHKAIKEQAKKWKARGEWVKHELGPKDAYYSSPTDMVGEWIVVKAITKGSGISRLTPQGREEVTFTGPSCRKESGRFAQPKPLPDHVGDKELQEFVSTNSRGLIYVWSVKNQDSFKGITEIQKSAEKLGLPLWVVLDKDVPQNEYQKYKEDLGEKFTKRVDAVEFNMRSLEAFPTVMVFKDGKILLKMITGLKTSEEYQKEVSKQLK
jgi:hypothetical protein